MNKHDEERLDFVLQRRSKRDYDLAGRMAFGKHEFERFERVPTDYLRYLVRSGMDLSWYPNLQKHIEERLQYDE